MSSITSPRPSLSIRSPSASSRNSLDVPTIRSTNSRRNRAALRDYYGLKGASSRDPSPAARQAETLQEEREVSELDKEGFDAAAYVKGVLTKQNLEGVLRVEAGLLSEIRGLDGERKALVYDNYSKLIAATDTIRKMRTNMDPLTPTTSTLSPAIAHIAETAATLAASLADRKPTPPTIVTGNSDTGNPDTNGHVPEVQNAQQTVRWVLDAPRRFRLLASEGKSEVAETEWKEIRRLLDKWQGVKGAGEVREQCEAALTMGET